MIFKDLIREILIQFHLDITKNLKYDRLTRLIIKKIVTSQSVCVDIGCHKGEILDLIRKQSPNQKHFAFEPIPYLFKNLKSKYGDSVALFNCALSNEKGKTTFNYVKNAPAYSGIKQRKYDIANPEIELLDVKLELLDDIIPQSVKVDLIKIDVEGAEFQVLKGAINTIKNSNPIIIFETGIGASEFYGTTPEDLFDFFSNILGYQLFILQDWLNTGIPMNRTDFIETYNTNKEYYFLAQK